MQKSNLSNKYSGVYPNFVTPFPKLDPTTNMFYLRADCAKAIGSPFLKLIGFPRIEKYLEKSPNYCNVKEANMATIHSICMANLILSLISSIHLVVPSSRTSYTLTRAVT